MLQITRRTMLAAERWVLLSPRARSISIPATPPKPPPVARDSNGHIDIPTLLSTPTWSVASLLPPKDKTEHLPEISSKQLHHLLRLSALPPPSSPEEEKRMLATLSSQVHFVKAIQNIDTTGIEPLQSLRDETAEGEKASELGLEALRSALEMEEGRGSEKRRRIRRRKTEVGERIEGEEWDVLGTAGRKTGRYFVVEGGAKS
ncbi:hypothetical protein LTR62_004495 [Meristemomyces frigidus]|uniref:Glutamyl-tRNA amidotransferase complex subunit Gta3 domain-containing protein n=1 Tax=Meristemomyces frigidus TaxID=1508187 RepID=A0AAN7TES0_9PEZI|nr:hypothetical protein LTR62_004495 [Meristemomyces frigidus]